MRSQVWNHLGTRMEMVGNAFYMVGVHHTLHHFLVHRKWHVNFGTFDHGRPMLVAYGMSQFYTDACNVSPVFRSQSRQVDNEYRTQFDSDNDSLLRFGMIVYDVTIVHFLVTLQGNGVFFTVGIGGYKPALLCGPLVEDQFNPFQSFQSLFPFRVVDISYDFFAGFSIHNGSGGNDFTEFCFPFENNKRADIMFGKFGNAVDNF